MLTDIIKSIVRSLGFDLRRLTPDANASFQLLAALRKFDVDLILDVGANAGQFGSELRAAGYAGELVSFEPLAEPHAALSHSARSDAAWHVHPRCALGDRDGELTINVSANSWSSSALPMLPLHSSVASDSSYVGIETAPVERLDSVAAAYLDTARSPFLKLDAQGYEWQILDGAVLLLPRMTGVLCELSLVPLYEGQRMWLDLIARLEREGFTLWGLRHGFMDPSDGRTLQVDATFFRL